MSGRQNYATPRSLNNLSIESDNTMDEEDNGAFTVPNSVPNSSRILTLNDLASGNS